MEINSKFITALLSTALRKLIKKKTGIDIELHIQDVGIYDSDGERLSFSVRVNGYIDKSELQKIIDNGLRNI